MLEYNILSLVATLIIDDSIGRFALEDNSIKTARRWAGDDDDDVDGRDPDHDKHTKQAITGRSHMR